jgi:hypothetical protein
LNIYIIYIVLITLETMTFTDLLEKTLPTRRGSLCRLYTQRRRLSSLCKKKRVSRRRLLEMLRGMVNGSWANKKDLVYEVRMLVENVLQVCNIHKELVLMYLAGHVPHTHFVLQLNRAQLSRKHIAH